MAIKGSLDEVSLPDVIQLLARGQKSGQLSLVRGSNFGSIFLDHGFVTFAHVVNRRDRLGDVLVKQGRITPEQLAEAIEEQTKNTDIKLGEILVERGAISRQELEQNMTTQIEEAVYHLFSWSTGTFQFVSGAVPEDQDFLVVINPEFLLLEGARRVDEWTLIEKKIPSFDIITTVDRARLDASDVQLTVQQRTLVDLIDDSRDVSQLIDESGMTEFEVGKALYGLMSAGFVVQSGRRAKRRSVAEESRVAEHRNLGLAFYGSGMYDESLREFRKVAELAPKDASAFFYQGLIALRQAEWNEAANRFTRAAELSGGKPGVLNNLACSLERSNLLDEAEAVYAEVVRRDRNNPTVVTGWGVVALRKGDYEVAADRLDDVRELVGDKPPPPIWYWARSLTAAAVEDFETAELLLREGLDKHTDDAVLLNNLAVILELSGDLDGAEELLARAQAKEPSLPQLSKNLGDVNYRSGRFDEAWEAYTRATKLKPDLGDDVYFKLGNIAYKRLDRDRAEECWRQALQLNPQHQLAKMNLETMGALA